MKLFKVASRKCSHLKSDLIGRCRAQIEPIHERKPTPVHMADSEHDADRSILRFRANQTHHEPGVDDGHTDTGL